MGLSAKTGRFLATGFFTIGRNGAALAALAVVVDADGAVVASAATDVGVDVGVDVGDESGVGAGVGAGAGAGGAGNVIP